MLKYPQYNQHIENVQIIADVKSAENTGEREMRKKKRRRFDPSAIILCALVFFVIAGTAFCMVANSKEESAQKQRIAAKKQAEKEEIKRAEELKVKKAEEERMESCKVKPGTPVGTLDPDMSRKVVYLTFDDGPSENTKKILDILDRYDAKATFFITGANKEKRHLIRDAYNAGHTIGLHTYTHDYASVYSSVDAYFEDLEKVGKVAEEQIGYVPCFIRFPGGSSNQVSAKYSPGIMTQLTKLVQEKGYQYYDWNVDSGDGAGLGTEEIKKHSVTDRYQHVMLLFHDSQAKEDTVEALPAIMDYYKGQGYEFCAIDRNSFVSQHAVLN